MNVPINPQRIAELLKEDIIDDYYSLESLKFIPCGNTGLNMRAVDAGFMEDEAFLASMQLFGNTERIKKFLPNLDFSSKEAVQKWVFAISSKTEKGWEFAYAIRINSGVVGLIMVSTPAYNKAIIGFEEWTMDFFVIEPFEGKRIMKAMLPRFLQFLKNEIEVDSIYVIIDQDNSRCLNLIANFPFDEVDNSDFTNIQNVAKAPRVFECPLWSIRFS
jgi:RimJ/RimL family protein N-acetyltransferase